MTALCVQELTAIDSICLPGREIEVMYLPHPGRKQQLSVQEVSYMQSRAEAIQNMESTTHELAQFFRQIGSMVSQQGEVAIADQVISSATFFCLNL